MGSGANGHEDGSWPFRCQEHAAVHPPNHQLHQGGAIPVPFGRENQVITASFSPSGSSRVRVAVVAPSV